MSVVRNDWTADELDAFPEDHVRREVFDGTLRTRRTLPSTHQALTMLLAVELMRSCPDNLLVTHAQDVVLGAHRRVVPDVLAVSSSAARAGTTRFSAADVVLAVEIISPGTKRIDSVVKPAYYAEAGIPFYWLIAMSEHLTVTVFELSSESAAYQRVAAFTHDESIRLERPWSIDIPLRDIRPRNL